MKLSVKKRGIYELAEMCETIHMKNDSVPDLVKLSALWAR